MATRRINIRLFVEDVQSGATDAQLKDKYKLTSVGLRKAFTKLVDAEILEPSDVHGRLITYESPIAVEGVRLFSRNYLAFPVPVYEAQSLLVQGHIVDITERGLQVSGFPAQPQEVKNLLIRADEFYDIYPFVFEARCLWLRREDPDGEKVAGFEITDISELGLEQLHKLISVLTIRE
ncbi:MAG: hypothetical protein V1792_03205 [Pseudomonadota bacterium]